MVGKRITFVPLLVVCVLVLQILTVTGIGGRDDGFTDMNSDDHPIQMTVDDVWPSVLGMPDSKRAVFWYGNEVFFGVVRNETPGDFTSFLYHSKDGGKTWDPPANVTSEKDIATMRIEILINDGELFYLVWVRRSWGTDTSDFQSRSLNCYVLPVGDWANISKYEPQRMDDDHNGYMASYQLLVFKGEVYAFWTRSHYMDTMYKRYSGGNWSGTLDLETGTYMAYFSAVSSNISGKEMIHYVYLYFPEDVLYSTSSSDGLNWSRATKIWSNTDSFERISMTEWNDRLHLVVSELEGYDIYHSWSTDGSSWVPFMRIGQNTLNDLGYMNPRANAVGITGSSDLSKLLVAYDTNQGVELIGSKNNGESFELMARFKNDTAFYPSFCSEGRFMIYADNDNRLSLRRLGNGGSGSVPDEDDNSTDPPTPPDDNSTVPPDNGTDDDPMDNGTAPPPTNGTTEPGNGTDEDGNDTVPEPPGNTNNPPNRPKMVFMEGDFFDGVEISIRGSGNDPDENDTELNYTWYIEGMGIVGFGPSLRVTLPEGKYNLTLRVTDPQGAYSELTTVLVVRQTGGTEIPVKPRTINGLLLISMIILQIMLVAGLGIFMLRRIGRRKHPAGDAPVLPSLSSGAMPEALSLETGARAAPVPPEQDSDLLGTVMEPTPFDLDDGVRRGMLEDSIPNGPGSLRAPDDLDGLREVVEERGLRDPSDLMALREKAKIRHKDGEVPQNIYMEIEEILDLYGR